MDRISNILGAKNYTELIASEFKRSINTVDRRLFCENFGTSYNPEIDATNIALSIVIRTSKVTYNLKRWLTVHSYDLLTRQPESVIGELLNGEIHYLIKIADIFERHNNAKGRSNRKYQETKRNDRVATKRFKPRKGNQRTKGRDKQC